MGTPLKRSRPQHSYPMDTIKVRLQTTNKYKGIMDCFTKMRAKEGMTGFYKGMAFPLVTVAAVNSIAFGTYSQWMKNEKF